MRSKMCGIAACCAFTLAAMATRLVAETKDSNTFTQSGASALVNTGVAMEGVEFEQLYGPAIEVEEGAPRGGCNDPVYENFQNGSLQFNIGAFGPGTQVGHGIQLATGDWQLCQVQVAAANTTAPTGTPYNIRMRIWDACPTTDPPTVTPCGGSGANLLYEALSDAAGTSNTTATFTLRTWTISPNLIVSNQVWITFEATLANTRYIMDNGPATTGSMLGSGDLTLCTPTQSGCNFFVVNVPGGSVSKLVLFVDANPAPPSTGACCTPTGCLLSQTAVACAAADGVYFGANSDCTSCPAPFCQSGGDGQKPDFNSAQTSDANPSVDFRVADNFTPDVSGNITSVRWWGIYVDFPGGPVVCGTAPTDNFAITFFNSAGNRPDDIIAGPFNVSPTRTMLTQLFAGGPTWQYDATIPPVAVIANECHWMEIRNNTTGNCVWLWISSGTGDGVTAQSNGALPYPPGSNTSPDTAWCVNIPVRTNGCNTAVELPGACCLPDGTCVDGQTSLQCDTANGTFSGSNSTCATDPCPLICQVNGEGQLPSFNGQGAGNTVATTSDSGIGFKAADNFSPDANGSITSVRWWGIYNNFTTNVDCVATDAFTITFYNDAADTPFQVLAGPLSVTATRRNTGFQNNGRIVYEYDATIPPFAVTANQCYWMEIQNNLTGSCNWLWNVSEIVDGVSSQHFGTDPYNAGDVNDFDLAWCITGASLHPDGCDSAIELPGACCRDQGTLCLDNEGASACAEAGGTFLGVGTTCTANACKGACCDIFNTSGGGCTLQTEDACTNIILGTFQGIGTDCTSSPCSGACCLSDGTCSDTTVDTTLTAVGCENSNTVGSWYPGAVCNGSTCPSFDQCDPDGLINLPCGSSKFFNNIAQAFHEAAGDTPPNGLPVFPVNPNSSCVPTSNGAGNFWVTFTGTGSSMEITTCGSDVEDTLIAVYEYDAGVGCPTLLTIADEVGCSDDDDFCGTGSFLSRICLNSTVNGRTYYLQVSSFTTVGGITVNVNCPCSVACSCPGDVAGNAGPTSDGVLNAKDIQEFVRCLLGTGTNCGCADVDGLNGIDVAGDIPAFVTRLLNGSTCP